MEKQNRLSLASSPYLRQHATNPVDWYEWGEEALMRAKTENKPILISIGYAACHWCHVMANQSFTDHNIASVMNRNFICIKIDREERPDIDRIYMDAVQLMTGRGGWPLNAFALPDGRPFFAGTYFPPSQWLDIIIQLGELYQNDYSKVLHAATSITEQLHLNSQIATNAWDDVFEENYHNAFENHLLKVDFKWGGYQGQPKFMMPTGLEFFLQYHLFTQNKQALQALEVSLHAMAMGGIYDQIGGGFARYSTDQYWKVPHFEKMLYDNSQLISLYAKAYQVTHRHLYQEVVEQTIGFLERELFDPQGAYYASIDADSEHEEGRFYVWSKEEMQEVLGPKVSQIILPFYQIEANGNWENGKNILHYTGEKSEYAASHQLSLGELNLILKKSNHLLLQHRNHRVRPSTDDKILTAWNAQLLSAYVAAYKAFLKDRYLEKSISIASFLEQNMITDDGLLYRVFKDGKVSVEAFLDDYASLANAFIDLYEVTFDIKWLNLSLKLTEFALLHFNDVNSDLYFYTSDQSENLILRTHEISDNVIPASNSVLAHVLNKLARFYDREDFAEKAQLMLCMVKDEVIQHGQYYANWGLLMGKKLYPTFDVVVMGENSADISLKLQQRYFPNAIFSAGVEEELPIHQNRLVQHQTLIYICKDNVCFAPVDTIDAALELMK